MAWGDVGGGELRSVTCASLLPAVGPDVEQEFSARVRAF